jgi:hypothetical protein
MMPVDQQKMHLLALKAALMTTLSAGQGQIPGQMPGQAPMQEQAPPMAPPQAPMAAPPVAPPAPPALPVQKTESDPVILEKLQALEKALGEKDKIIEGFGAIAENLKRIISGGRKSAHSLSMVARPDGLAKTEGDVSQLTRPQIFQKLNEVVAKGNLSKSDKDLIISFTAGAKPDVSKIAHLLK